MSTTDRDLTARARIRNAALAEFVERGSRGMTIRGVAEKAGVSPALVQHHFRTKERLREECDAYVMESIRGEVTAGVDERQLDDPSFVAAVYQNLPLLTRYLSRALVEGSAAAARAFDEMVDLTEVYLKEHSDAEAIDLRAQAAVFVAMKLGVLVLGDHVSRAIGVDLYDPKGAPRVSRAGLDIVSPDFVGRDLADLARTGLDRYEQDQR